MKISARNMLQGKVKLVRNGQINAEVVVELPSGQEITAVVTVDAVESLGLKPGSPVCAVIKASSVMLAVE